MEQRYPREVARERERERGIEKDREREADEMKILLQHENRKYFIRTHFEV